MSLGLTDASLMVLADRLGVVDIATLDERHYRAARPPTGAAAFRVPPADRRCGRAHPKQRLQP